MYYSIAIRQVEFFARVTTTIPVEKNMKVASSQQPLLNPEKWVGSRDKILCEELAARQLQLAKQLE